MLRLREPLIPALSSGGRSAGVIDLAIGDGEPGTPGGLAAGGPADEARAAASARGLGGGSPGSWFVRRLTARDREPVEELGGLR